MSFLTTIEKELFIACVSFHACSLHYTKDLYGHIGRV